MRTLLQDLRYAMRQLWKSPGFTLAAVLTLTIGIGANTAIFSSMDAVVLHPLAVPQLDRVVTIAEEGREGWSGYLQASLANFEDWSRQSRSFEQMAVLASSDMNLTGAGDAAHVRAARNSANFFRVLRAQPLIGRVFQESECEQGRDGVAVLNYGFWERRFGSSASVLGRKVELDGRAYEIVGVMPKTMQYPGEVDVFVPFAPTPQQLSDRTNHDYLAIARLRDGVTVMQAQAEMRTIADRLTQAYPKTNIGWTVKVEPLLDGINGPYTPLYYKMLMGATLFVLLVVCANVANLQFARGIARRPEIAMRTALGASRSRIMRQLLTENVLLGIVGAVGGVAFGATYLHVILMTMPPRVARYMAGWSQQTTLSTRVLGFSLLIAVGAGVISGFAPALQALRLNLVDQLKSGSRGATGSGRTHRLRNIFAVAQIAFAVALVIGAALMSKGMDSMLHRADIYGPNKVLTFSTNLPESHYDTPQKKAAWYNDGLAKLRTLPGVSHAEVTTTLPYSDQGWVRDCAIENRQVIPGKFQSAIQMEVSQGYFAALRIPIVSGRGFNQGDTLDTVPVAVVSSGFAAKYFPGENPIGHRIRMGSDPKKPEPWQTIVGVAEETNYSLWEERQHPAVYLSVAQTPPPGAMFALWSDGGAQPLAGPARKALAAIDSSLPLDGIETWQQELHEQLTGLIYASAMMAIDALIALFLSAIGIFAVMVNHVGERTREIGVRLALGARREDVLGMILRRASWLTGSGVCLGLVMAYALARLVANLLRGVRPDDPVVFAGITATVVAIALFASWLPARRAARIDPMAALRDD